MLLGEYQSALVFTQRVESTPLDNPTWTYVSFVYKDQGAYELRWASLGRHKGEFMSLGGLKKTAWVEPIEMYATSTLPVLTVVAFEGYSFPGIIAR